MPVSAEGDVTNVHFVDLDAFGRAVAPRQRGLTTNMVFIPAYLGLLYTRPALAMMSVIIGLHAGRRLWQQDLRS